MPATRTGAWLCSEEILNITPDFSGSSLDKHRQKHAVPLSLACKLCAEGSCITRKEADIQVIYIFGACMVSMASVNLLVSYTTGCCDRLERSLGILQRMNSHIVSLYIEQAHS